MINLSVTEEKYRLIIEGLLELQAKRSIDLILELDADAKKQLNKTEIE
jgi:hypothetical protein